MRRAAPHGTRPRAQRSALARLLAPTPRALSRRPITVFMNQAKYFDANGKAPINATLPTSRTGRRKTGTPFHAEPMQPHNNPAHLLYPCAVVFQLLVVNVLYACESAEKDTVIFVRTFSCTSLYVNTYHKEQNAYKAQHVPSAVLLYFSSILNAHTQNIQ